MVPIIDFDWLHELDHNHSVYNFSNTASGLQCVH